MFTWRGYKACISSGLPQLNGRELRRRFDLAFQSIMKLGKPDEQNQESFKKPNDLSQSSSSGTQPQSSYSSSRNSSESDEPTQIPETQLPHDQTIQTQIPKTQISCSGNDNNNYNS